MQLFDQNRVNKYILLTSGYNNFDLWQSRSDVLLDLNCNEKLEQEECHKFKHGSKDIQWHLLKLHIFIWIWLWFKFDHQLGLPAVSTFLHLISRLSHSPVILSLQVFTKGKSNREIRINLKMALSEEEVLVVGKVSLSFCIIQSAGLYSFWTEWEKQ